MPVFKRGRDSDSTGLYYKFLLYGHSGAGKTWLAATSPDALVVLTERNGEQSVRLSNPDAQYAIVSTFDEIRDVLRLAQSGELSTPESPVRTLVFDGLTEIQRMVKDEMIAERADGLMTMDMWGQLGEKMRRLLRMLRDLPYHVVCTALAETEMEGEVRHVFPAFQGKKLYDEVMQYFNAVGYVYREGSGEESEHVALFSAPSRIAAKPSFPLRGKRVGPVSRWVDEMAAAKAEDASKARAAAKEESKDEKPVETTGEVDPDEKTGGRRGRRGRANDSVPV